MSKPAQIQQIEDILANRLTLTEAPPEALMPYKENRPKYARDAAGNITGLNLAGCHLTDQEWKGICAMEGLTLHLQGLNLSMNQLGALHFDAAFQHLRELNLAENEILDQLRFDAPLPLLERLDASECRLSTLTLPRGFERLKWLDLRKNQLTDIQLSTCPALEALDASVNQLPRFVLPEGFSGLKYLFLNGNEIAALDIQDELSELRLLRLDDNCLPKIAPGFLDDFPRLQFLNIKNNPVTSALSGFTEDEKNNLASVKRFLEEMSDGSDIDNECKILLVGNGNVGKSCLIERLVHDRFVEEWNSTHAISLTPYNLNNEYRLNLWDFGGQDIYHATHRLFMQKEAVYLLLWDGETEKLLPNTRTEAGKQRTYDNHSLHYWLDYIHFIGGGECPVIVVQTKMFKEGQGKKDPPGGIRDTYRDRFDFLEFEHIDSQLEDWSENGFEELLLTLKKAVRRVQPKKEIPLKYADIRRQLRELQAAGDLEMDMDKYLRTAADLKIKDPELVLEKFLQKTGVVFYRKGLFKNKIILNQEKAIKAIYTLFDREEMYYEILEAKKGRFSGADLQKYWKNVTDNEVERELFISFMLSCEMCFETTPQQEDYHSVPFDERTFTAPQLLPVKKPVSVEVLERNWKAPMLHLCLHQEYLHYGVIQSFIVRTWKLAEIDDIWRYGILLVDEGENAIIEARDKKIIVSAAFTGKALFQKIRNLLRELQDSASLESVSIDGQHYVALEELKTCPSGNRFVKTIEGGVSVEVEPLRLFLNLDEKLLFDKNVEEKSETGSMDIIKTVKDMSTTPNAPRKPKIFISYAHKDERYKNELVNHLASLKNQDLVDAWQDRSIESGDWDDQIQKAMDEADIFLLLITSNFIGSKYITEREITTAYQKYKAGKAKIFPVIVDACAWQLQPVTKTEKEMHPVEKREMFVWLGKFQPFPTDGKPIKNWKNRNDAFLKVIESLKEEILKMT